MAALIDGEINNSSFRPILTDDAIPSCHSVLIITFSLDLLTSFEISSAFAPRTTIIGFAAELIAASMDFCNKLLPSCFKSCFGSPNREEEPAASIMAPVSFNEDIRTLKLISLLR